MGSQSRHKLGYRVEVPDTEGRVAGDVLGAKARSLGTEDRMDAKLERVR